MDRQAADKRLNKARQWVGHIRNRCLPKIKDQRKNITASNSKERREADLLGVWRDCECAADLSMHIARNACIPQVVPIIANNAKCCIRCGDHDGVAAALHVCDGVVGHRHVIANPASVAAESHELVAKPTRKRIAVRFPVRSAGDQLPAIATPGDRLKIAVGHAASVRGEAELQRLRVVDIDAGGIGEAHGYQLARWIDGHGIWSLAVFGGGFSVLCEA